MFNFLNLKQELIMIEIIFDPVLIIVVFLLFNVIIIVPIIMFYRITINNCIKRQISRMTYLNFRNNTVDIDTGTITCSESENSNSICSDNYSDNSSDIECGSSINNDMVDCEFKDLNEIENEIRNAVYL